jgi:membrane protein
MDFKKIWGLIKSAFTSWQADYAPSMGAALSYYTMFSIAPLLLIVISIAGLIFGEQAARGEIFDQIKGLIGDQGAQAVQGMLASVNKPGQGAATAGLGIVLLLIGATTVFGELQDDLDRIWDAPAREGSGLWKLLRARILSFGMILGIAFLLLVSLVASAAIAALGHWWGSWLGGWETLAHAINLVLSFALTTAVFALIYKVMPRVQIRWHDVWIGAAITALLFTVGKFLISLYIGKSGITSGFGAAGSLVVLLVWVYYSAQIFLLGAEFTWAYSNTFGSRKDKTEKPVLLDKQVRLVPKTATTSASASKTKGQKTQPQKAKVQRLPTKNNKNNPSLEP